MKDSSPWERLRSGLGPWLPFTGRGIAEFGRAGPGRLLLFQALFSGLFSLSLVWGVRQIVLPVVQNALMHLPEVSAGIQDSRLRWPDREAAVLASSPQLAVSVNPDSSAEFGLNGDVQIELRETNLVVRGVLGSYASPYPPGLDLPLDRMAAGAEWGAWRAPMLAILGMASFVFQLIFFWTLPLLYTLPAWILGWVLHRSIRLTATYRIAAAALWAAALLPTAAIPLYTLLRLRIPGITLMCLAQFVVGWIGLIWAITSLPPRPQENRQSSNPFAESNGPRAGTPRRKRNPFHS
ncbi:MAG: hypothetical protein U1G08_21470 [Verrucomicrobiota bacterium]